MFYEGLYVYQKTGVNTARTLYIKSILCDLVSKSINSKDVSKYFKEK